MIQIPGWTHQRSGKVRDLYTNDKNELLIVASDRISAFDYILPTPIPNKGKILTQLSNFWFEYLKDIVSNHVISTKVPDVVQGRAVIVKPLTMFPVECVVRGYLTGSGWSEYQKSQSVCGIKLPAGLKDGSKLPEPIFTPATKAEDGQHDENISFAEVEQRIGRDLANNIREVSIRLYREASDYAATKGIIIADTKFEFGLDAAGTLHLLDTPMAVPQFAERVMGSLRNSMGLRRPSRRGQRQLRRRPGGRSQGSAALPCYNPRKFAS